MGYGKSIIQKDLKFNVTQGAIFIIMGGSGSGKSTLLRHLIGLKAPLKGDIEIFGFPISSQNEDSGNLNLIRRKIGVLFQSGALWSALTLAENIELPLSEFTEMNKKERRDLAGLKLTLVGLSGFGDYYPAEISGGMRKRAGLARAMALDPKLIFLDEPSAGLDPISSHNLDELILELRDALQTTFVIVTHELASIFAIGSDTIFLDPDLKTIRARGSPRELLQNGDDVVKKFLSRSQIDK